MKIRNHARFSHLFLCGVFGVFVNVSSVSAESQGLTCSQLNSFVVGSGLIGLPTNGAIVTSAQVIPASGSGAQALGEYCKVYGDIKSIDPQAPDIGFQLHLPAAWNHKSMMFGGGGFDGELDVFVNFTHAGPSNQLSAQGRGYAVFGSNGGHKQQPPFIFGRDGSFGMNDEAVANFGYQALKKTRDTAMQIIRTYYGSLPQKNYFHGGSTGGREAIIALQKWPQDYDGTIAIYPALEFTAWFMQNGRISQALSQPGAYLNHAKRRLLHDAVMAACDRLDGVVDGIISNIQKCNQRFSNTHSGSRGLRALRCPGGVDSSDSCFSDVQIDFLTTMSTAIHLPFTLANGASSYPGYNIWGGDLGYPDDNQFLLSVLGLNSVSPVNPVGPDQPLYTIYFDQWMKYFVTRDGAFNSVGLSPTALTAYQSRINQLSLIQNSRIFDLSAFHAKGGKLLMLHGTADTIISNRISQEFYDGLVDAMGKSKVGKFVRYYEVPGYNHSVGLDFNAGWDSITALERWVELGQAPQNQIVEDKNVLPLVRTRPLCEYPGWPRYNGSGNVNLASSFHCVTDHSDDDDDDD